MNNGRKADRVIICTGAAQATEQAFNSYDQGGKIIFFATPPENVKTETEWYQHWRNKPTIEMTYGATPESCRTAFELIKHRVIHVQSMISHKLPLEKIAEGFRIASEGNCLKVIINPHGG
jgi:L-iditol 2-dehydrogenase